MSLFSDVLARESNATRASTSFRVCPLTSRSAKYRARDLVERSATSWKNSSTRVLNRELFSQTFQSKGSDTWNEAGGTILQSVRFILLTRATDLRPARSVRWYLVLSRALVLPRSCLPQRAKSSGKLSRWFQFRRKIPQV